MSVSTQPGVLLPEVSRLPGETGTWTGRARLLWARRRLLLRVFLLAAPLSICVVMLIPKEYESGARIMPPDRQNTTAPVLAALASRAGALGPLGALAGGLIGARPTTALFVNLLQSSTVTGHLVDRFQLQSVYGKRYAVDAAKKLEKHTKIGDDKKSGVITILVEDHDPVRARDLAQAYLDELNRLVVATSNSSAHQERVFIQKRLQAVTSDLEKAQQDLSEYSSRHNAVDLKEQTRAMVDAGARIEAAMVIEESTLNSVRQVYGDENIRVREAEARLATLRRELGRLGGSSTSEASDSATPEPIAANDLYPPLRQVPKLAVPYANLYRRVRVQEALYELLTQQYETARIDEAKDIPAVAVIDSPGVPQKKSFPPRALFAGILTAVSLAATILWILLSCRWGELPEGHDLRVLIRDVRHWRRDRQDGGA